MEEGSPEAGPRMLRLIMLARLDLVLLFFIVFVMAVKPEFVDSAFLEGLPRRGSPAGSSTGATRVALSQPPPGPAAGQAGEPG